MATRVQDQLWYANLAKPEGRLGHVAGEFMAKENYELNMWAVHSLQVQEGEKVLEIGFGPGTAIEEMLKTTLVKYVAGIDYSELMVKKAKKRNASVITEGKVDLRYADVAELPDFGTTFDKVLVVNNVMYWPEIVKSLRKIRRALNPNGVISLVIQRDDKTFRQGQCREEISYYLDCLKQAGFVKVGVLAEPITLERKLGQFTLAGIAIYGFSPVACQQMPRISYVARCKALLSDVFSQSFGAGTLGLLQCNP